MPMICSCDTLFIPSSFCSAVQTGRIQLFETMKRDGAGSLENVVMPQGSDAIHRPVSNLGKGG